MAETLSKAKNTTVSGMVEAHPGERQGAAPNAVRRLGPRHQPTAHSVGDGAPLDPLA